MWRCGAVDQGTGGAQMGEEAKGRRNQNRVGEG